MAKPLSLPVATLENILPLCHLLDCSSEKARSIVWHLLMKNVGVTPQSDRRYPHFFSPMVHEWLRAKREFAPFFDGLCLAINAALSQQPDLFVDQVLEHPLLDTGSHSLVGANTGNIGHSQTLPPKALTLVLFASSHTRYLTRPRKGWFLQFLLHFPPTTLPI